jgi:hypothetical protein
MFPQTLQFLSSEFFFAEESINAGVPPNPLIQFSRFQLSAVYRGPQKKI